MWIKICGLTSEEAVAAALAAGADALGFVFAASPRRLTPHEARRLAGPARGRVACVAVTRHPEPETLAEILRVFEPDVLQSDAADLAGLRLPAALQLLPVVRAGAPAPEPLPRRLLFEGPVSGIGTAADWQAASALALRAELVLAGGLHAGNVRAAITAVRPFGVDVSSGVEARPGLKSPPAIGEFVAAVRAVEGLA
jgi:phosphoribosylanthranilate isomerase